MEADVQTDYIQRKKKILIVEDDLFTQQLIEKIIMQVDPTVELHWAMTGQEALGLVTRECAYPTKAFDIVFFDIRLPGTISGLDLWQECESNFPWLNVVLMSGAPFAEVYQKLGSSNYGICPAYLQKPFGTIECKDLIKELMYDRSRDLSWLV